MTILKHELRQNRKSLLIWSAIIGGMIIAFMLLYPAIKEQMSDISESFASMGSFTAAFGMDKLNMATAMGYFGIEVGASIALCGSLFAALTGAAVLAKEEGGHTAEFLLTHPVSRRRVVSEKLAFVFVQVLIFNIFCFFCSLLSFIMIGESFEIKKLLLFHAAQLIMGLEIACICFGISAFQKKANLGLGLGMAILLYILSLFSNVSENAEWLKYITPFQYADTSKLFPDERLDGVLIAIGCGYALISVVAAYIGYGKKDIAA